MAFNKQRIFICDGTNALPLGFPPLFGKPLSSFNGFLFQLAIAMNATRFEEGIILPLIQLKKILQFACAYIDVCTSFSSIPTENVIVDEATLRIEYKNPLCDIKINTSLLGKWTVTMSVRETELAGVASLWTTSINSQIRPCTSAHIQQLIQIAQLPIEIIQTIERSIGVIRNPIPKQKIIIEWILVHENAFALNVDIAATRIEFLV